MGEVANFTTRRDQLKFTIKIFKTYIQCESINHYPVICRKSKIDDVGEEFEQVQTAIELEDTTNINDHRKYSEELEELVPPCLVPYHRTLILLVRNYIQFPMLIFNLFSW